MYLTTSTFITLVSVFHVCLCDFKVLLLHNNDMHAHFQPVTQSIGICGDDMSVDCYGGFARVKTTVDTLKQKAASQGIPTIFLNAGDSFQGTYYYTFFKWPIVSQFVSMLGIDVMSLGNHEFDDGVKDLAPYLHNVTVPSVCCNLNISQEPSLDQPNLTPSKVLTVNNVKIGVIGYLTPETVYFSDTGKVEILDEISSIRKEAKNLLAQGVKILIALGHSGYIKDQQIAQEVEEIDIVVGGHSHTFLYTGTPPDSDEPKGEYPTVITQSSGKRVPVVQAFYATKYLGYLKLDFDDDGNLKSWDGLPILLKGTMSQDKMILDELKPFEQKVANVVDEIVGYSEVLLDNIDMKCKLGECNIGNLITDAFVDYVTRHYDHPQGWTMAAVGLCQAGGIRSSIDPKTNVNHNGSITVGDVITVLPWGSNITVYNMTGHVLHEALEYSVGRYEDTVQGHVPEFLQVSGLHVVYNMDKPKGNRVESITVRCADCNIPVYQPLNLTQTYTVVMPEYLGRGGDGFDMFKTNSTKIRSLNDVDYAIVSEYIKLHTPVYVAIEGRISIVHDGSSSSTVKCASTFTILIMAILMLLQS